MLAYPYAEYNLLHIQINTIGAYSNILYMKLLHIEWLSVGQYDVNNCANYFY